MSNTSQRSKFSAAPSQIAASKPDTRTKLKYSIAMRKGIGLYVSGSDGTSLEACPAFSVKGCVVDANGQNPAYLMCFETLLGDEVTEAIPLTAFASPAQLVKLLLSRGFAVPQNNIKERGQAIKHYMEYHCPIEKKFIRVEGDGWIELPDKTLVYGFGKKTFGVSSSKYGVYCENPKDTSTCGGREQWNDLVEPLKNDVLAVLVMCAAFASVLLKPLNIGSLMLFLVGISSSGKTILLSIAASIFGRPSDMFTWTGTTNGIEANLLNHRDKPFILDEVGQGTARQFDELSYIVSNGASKQRATSNGSPAKTSQARSVVLGAGELSALDRMQQSGIIAKQGQVARLVGVPVSEKYGVWCTLGEYESGKHKSDAVKQKVQEVYGVAGKVFCRKIAPEINDVQQGFEETSVDLEIAIRAGLELDDADGVPGRVLNCFALFAYAGLLAVHKKILPFEETHVMNAVTRGYQLWYADYRKRQPARDADLLAPVRLFLQSKRGVKFKPLAHWRDSHHGTLAGFEHTKRQNGTHYFLVFPDYFKSHMCGDFQPSEVIAALDKASFLAKGPRNTPTIQQHMPEGGGVHRTFYGIRSTILDS